jgi:phage shock protein PspC (stress-responsive transcriptional regulator)
MNEPQTAQTQAPAGPGAATSLRRPWHGRMLAGVAAGVADYLDVDVVVVRIALVILTVLGGVGPVAYVAGWLLIPAEGAPCSVLEHLLARVQGAQP